MPAPICGPPSQTHDTPCAAQKASLRPPQPMLCNVSCNPGWLPACPAGAHLPAGVLPVCVDARHERAFGAHQATGPLAQPGGRGLQSQAGTARVSPGQCCAACHTRASIAAEMRGCRDASGPGADTAIVGATAVGAVTHLDDGAAVDEALVGLHAAAAEASQRLALGTQHLRATGDRQHGRAGLCTGQPRIQRPAARATAPRQLPVRRVARSPAPARSGPPTWTLHAGMRDRASSPPATPISRAATSEPTTADRLGAILPILPSTNFTICNPPPATRITSQAVLSSRAGRHQLSPGCGGA